MAIAIIQGTMMLIRSNPVMDKLFKNILCTSK